MDVKRSVDPKWIRDARGAVERVHGDGAAIDEAALRVRHFHDAITDPLYRRLGVLFGDRIIGTRPHRTLYAEHTRTGRFHVVKPQGISERIKTNKEYVLESTVLRTGTGVHRDDVRAGDRILVSQFAGSIWYDTVRGRESELWLFATGDVILKIAREAGEHSTIDAVIANCVMLLDDALLNRCVEMELEMEEESCQ